MSRRYLAPLRPRFDRLMYPALADHGATDPNPLDPLWRALNRLKGYKPALVPRRPRDARQAPQP